jgi:hypothetical protein
MAIIPYTDLLQIVREHPRYFAEWEKGVDAKISLVIDFGRPEGRARPSEVFDIVNGLELVVTQDSQGKVFDIEIT